MGNSKSYGNIWATREMIEKARKIIDALENDPEYIRKKPKYIYLPKENDSDSEENNLTPQNNTPDEM